MKTYQLKLEFLSPALVGSGEGYSATIDSDIVFDDVGIPFIPAKRIKGCLLDSVNQVQDMFKCASVDLNLPVSDIFGVPGAESSAPVYFSNLVIENYDQTKAWLEYFLKSSKYKPFVSKEAILETFTEIRRQTCIDETGVALHGSLRTSRIIRKGLIFVGDVCIKNPDKEIVETIAFACMNFRRFGTNRNRGFGEVSCTFSDFREEVSPLKTLEEVCIS